MKKLYLIPAAVLVILLVIIFAVPAMLSSESLRARFAAQLSSMTGSQIALNGPVRFSIVPELGIVAEDVAIAAGSGGVAVSVKKTVASIQLTTLFSDQIRITGIELERPEIELRSVAGTETADGSAETGDVFKAAANLLQRLSIDEITVTEGAIRQTSADRSDDIAGDINLAVAIPGVDQQSALEASGTFGGRQIQASVQIASLRQLLERQPTAVEIKSEMTPPPHPTLARVSVTGNIQLADDGSYRIVDGTVTTADQPMRMDALYRPGARSYVSATVRSESLDFAYLQQQLETTEGSTAPTEDSSGPDLSALATFDADVELQIDKVTVGDAAADGFRLVAALKDGRVNSTLSATRVAGGTVTNQLGVDVRQPQPLFQGVIEMNSVSVQEIATLLGLELPLAGDIATDLQYAFRGASAAALRNTVNAAGTVSLSNGEIDVPALSFAGPAAGTVSALNLTATLRNIESPVGVEGSLAWNGETVSLSGEVSALELLSKNIIATTLLARSRPLQARFDGTVSPDGTASGNANLEAASLSRMLAWFGQDPGTPLGRLSYSGGVSIGNDRFVFDPAQISLDDINARGSATIATGAKPAITASLAVDDLNLSRLTGGAGTGGASPAASGATAIDLAMLRTFDADIRLEAQSIGYGEVVAGPVSGTLTVKDGVAKLTLPQAGFYGGAVRADVVADGSSDVPAIDLDVGMNGVDALPLLDAAADFRRIEGKLEAAVDVKGSGRDTQQLASTLDGSATVKFSNGALRGIDIASIINNLRTVFATGYVEDPEERTEFTELSVTMAIENGIANTDDIRLLGPLVRMDGAGQVNLAAQTIEMRLNPKLVGSLDGQGGNFDVSGLGLPFIVTGPLSKPQIYPDLTALLSNPDDAFRKVAALKEGLKALGKGKLDAVAIVKDQLGGGTAGDVVSGVVDGLTRKNDGGSSGDRTKDLIGSVIQGLAGGNEQPAEGAQQPVEDGAFDGEFPKTVVILVPTPNPRKPQDAQPPPEPEQPPSVTDQVVDQVVPRIVPEEQRDDAGRLLKGLLEGLGNNN